MQPTSGFQGATISILGLILRVQFLGSQLYGLNPYNSVVMTIAVLTLGFAAPIAAQGRPATGSR